MENGVRTLGKPWEHKEHGEQHRVRASGCENIEKPIAFAPGRRRLSRQRPPGVYRHFARLPFACHRPGHNARKRPASRNISGSQRCHWRTLPCRKAICPPTGGLHPPPKEGGSATHTRVHNARGRQLLDPGTGGVDPLDKCGTGPAATVPNQQPPCRAAHLEPKPTTRLGLAMQQRDERFPHRPGRHPSPDGTRCDVHATWPR